MARSPSPAESLPKEVVAQAVTPPLKAGEFRKTAMNYHRRRGDVVQVVNIQVSHGSTGLEKIFYINVGLAFDALCELAGIAVQEKPKEYDCDRAGIRVRLEEWISGALPQWVVRHGQDASSMVEALRGMIEQLRTELDRIDGPAAFRAHPWFECARPFEVRAKILYVLGDLDGAWREVQDLADALADRQNASKVHWWVNRLRLSALEPRLKELAG